MMSKIYTIRSEQKLPVSIHEAWEFFSSPENLSRITPPYMGFRITNDRKPGKMYAGQIISYIVRPLAGIPMTWVTEITHVNKPHFFVDEQRFGPYAFWHHQHHFEEIEGGVLMTDIVHYRLPLGPLGMLANAILVKGQLRKIFSYRTRVLTEMFGTL